MSIPLTLTSSANNNNKKKNKKKNDDVSASASIAGRVLLAEVSCIQYEPEAPRSRNEAERMAILDVCKRLEKRGYYGGILQYALAHRNSGHVHVAIAVDEEDEGYICRCCKEARRPISAPKDGPLRYRVCDCGDCVACDEKIRVDLEQITRD